MQYFKTYWYLNGFISAIYIIDICCTCKCAHISCEWTSELPAKGKSKKQIIAVSAIARLLNWGNFAAIYLPLVVFHIFLYADCMWLPLFRSNCWSHGRVRFGEQCKCVGGGYYAWQVSSNVGSLRSLQWQYLEGESSSGTQRRRHTFWYLAFYTLPCCPRKNDGALLLLFF